MKQCSIETQLPNGRGSGLQPYASFLSSSDGAPLSFLTDGEDEVL